MDIIKIDESYVNIRASNRRELEALKQVAWSLRTERDGWQYDYLVKIGRASKWVEHYEWVNEDTLRLESGHLEIPPIRELLGLEGSGLPEAAASPYDGEFELMVGELDLPFTPYDYQLKAASRMLSREKGIALMATGSGKSLTISLVLETFRRRKLKGCLIVPNINLLTQFKKDIKSYNLGELYESIHGLGGSQKFVGILEPSELLITTWQSLVNLDSSFYEELDYIVCDEVHRFSSQCTAQLIRDTKKAKIKLGFTGTLPDSKTSKMILLGLFGVPEVFVTSNDLIEAGRGTPIYIQAIKLNYEAEESKQISGYTEYLDRVKFLTDHTKRTALIGKIGKLCRSRNEGSCLILYTLIEHGHKIYQEIAGTEPGSLEEMRDLGVYFMDGSMKATDREKIRLWMDEQPNAVLVANYTLLSTGVNIKSLRWMVFASPLKSYTSITQSLGRGIRTSEGKTRFDVFDIVDYFPGGIRTFANSFNARKKIYAKNLFQLSERNQPL